jgi:hypothetical protein
MRWAKRVILAALGVAALVVAPVGAAWAARAVERVVVPPSGTIYNYLAVAWWQYALGQPKPTNPLLDPTGANCAQGQSGGVFFLTGTSPPAPGTVTRDACTVSGRRALFFPLITPSTSIPRATAWTRHVWCIGTSSPSSSAPTPCTPLSTVSEFGTSTRPRRPTVRAPRQRPDARRSAGVVLTHPAATFSIFRRGRTPPRSKTGTTCFSDR